MRCCRRSSCWAESRSSLPLPARSQDSTNPPVLLGIRGLSVTALSITDYIQLVDTTGRQWHPTKRGRITGKPAAVLERLGLDARQWTDRVRAIKPDQGFCRVIGSESALLAKAAEIGQRWLRDVGVARSLAH